MCVPLEPLIRALCRAADTRGMIPLKLTLKSSLICQVCPISVSPSNFHKCFASLIFASPDEEHTAACYKSNTIPSPETVTVRPEAASAGMNNFHLWMDEEFPQGWKQLWWRFYGKGNPNAGIRIRLWFIQIIKELFEKPLQSQMLKTQGTKRIIT